MKRDYNMYGKQFCKLDKRYPVQYVRRTSIRQNVIPYPKEISRQKPIDDVHIIICYPLCVHYDDRVVVILNVKDHLRVKLNSSVLRFCNFSSPRHQSVTTQSLRTKTVNHRLESLQYNGDSREREFMTKSLHFTLTYYLMVVLLTLQILIQIS